ncbi:MAG: S8 family peptidase [Candidatus Eremiobacteraeota bacterium]|nr:S8 family peptidase [Candidatus Eremiobacteraeota bacterium]
MQIDRTHSSTPISSKQLSPKKEPASPSGESSPAPADVVLFSAGDLTPKGKLPVILSSVTPEDKKQLEKLLKEKYNGRITSEIPLVNGYTVEINPSKMRQFISALPAHVGVSLDSKIKFPDPQVVIASHVKGGSDEEKNVYLQTYKLDKIWDKGITGKGVGVCVIDSGIFPHEDFGDRIVGWKDMSSKSGKEAYDPFGHGTHVSGIVAGSGKASEGKIKGVAPDASLVGVRITSVSEAIKGLQWAIENREKYGIKVINMSLGDYALKSYKDDPWAQAAEKAVEAGMVVVVAAGNEGPGASTISTPGTDPMVITVGSIDDKKTIQTKDDTIADSSSRGPTSQDKLTKPDVLAPGVAILSTLSPGSTLDMPEIPHVGDKYISFNGTSMATPIVAGLCALMLQANPSLTHEQIKEILRSTADKLPSLEENTQGMGRIDAVEALKKAEELKKPEALDKPTGKKVASHRKNSKALDDALSNGGWLIS